ncbi:MAG: 2-oxoacid ferredoxin oxidoreductase [Candidatus Moranbacteria bacterium]|nr:2-oxoacid ferredoxin oxidoreductase [Candidatus Moranbacteria bacterium]PIV86033.1 MAG: 2-oxoacid ferredoxin oxidoreductase [Candidatus Moranbacteria bacterium CG17_big_fil_post_rev_8_21_14_2_50_41_107]PIW94059.1 MAG: 2-oxoacid ferredoxin oxidoreductase [Candidatus Moranbacteria bacterium CG_4_8_14_3_um_filter_41_13]PIX91014.1 MAG: 2-oxoacid ferredoxin oxidoreductase [Candidatus Moranbacteria bacterium CG_4_10_14_3_um_filter_41_65]
MVDKKLYDMPRGTDMAWCPGCGNFPILNIVKMALSELDITPENAVICSGIGQAAKTPHYLRVNYFNGLHGRALPPAIAIKNVNPRLTVIAESGDGDTYGEGGNHFIHTIRRNPDITNIVHDNMIYGLTKGQASPMSEKGLVNPIQPDGVIVDQFNPLAVALSLDATFVARAFTGDILQTKEIIKAAILHKGYALVDVFQPCVVFNKQNTYQWFKEKCYYVDETHDKTGKMEALKLAFDLERLALGIIYERTGKPTYETLVREGDEPLYEKTFDDKALSTLIGKYT